MNSDLNSDDDRQDVSTMATLPINSNSDIKRPIPKTRQHDRKEIRKKLKVMMTDKVFITTEKGRQKVSLSHINREKPHEKGDFWRSKGWERRTFDIFQNFYSWTFAP